MKMPFSPWSGKPQSVSSEHSRWIRNSQRQFTVLVVVDCAIAIGCGFLPGFYGLLFVPAAVFGGYWYLRRGRLTDGEADFSSWFLIGMATGASIIGLFAMFLGGAALLWLRNL